MNESKKDVIDNLINETLAKKSKNDKTIKKGKICIGVAIGILIATFIALGYIGASKASLYNVDTLSAALIHIKKYIVYVLPFWVLSEVVSINTIRQSKKENNGYENQLDTLNKIKEHSENKSRAESLEIESDKTIGEAPELNSEVPTEEELNQILTNAFNEGLNKPLVRTRKRK